MSFKVTTDPEEYKRIDEEEQKKFEQIETQKVDMIKDERLDAMMRDIVTTFNLDWVQLVRLNGLSDRCRRISGLHLDNAFFESMLLKIKQAGLINWRYVSECPYCHEVIYQITDVPMDKLKICDTCQSLYIPKDHLRNQSIIIH